MQKDNAQNGYRDDIFNLENMVGFASQETMYQAHALYFDSSAGSGVLLTSGNDDYTKGRQVLNREGLNYLTASEGLDYKDFNQSYKRVAGEFFAAAIQKANQESVLIDTATTLEATTQPREEQQVVEDSKPTARFGADIAVGIPVTEPPADIPLAFKPDQTDVAVGPETTFEEKFATAMKGMFTDFESTQPTTTAVQTNRRDALQKNESEMAVYDEAVYKSERRLPSQEAVAPATTTTSRAARPTLAGFGKAQNFAKRGTEPKGKQGKQTGNTQKQQGKKGRGLFKK